MRVLIVSGSLPPRRCGVGDYARQLAATLAGRPNFSVAVLTTGPSAEPIAGVEVFAVMTRWSLREAGRFMRLVRRWSPDVVHLQYPTQGYADGGLLAALPMMTRLLGVALVRTWHEILTRIPGRRGLLLTLGHTLPVGEVIVVRPNFREHLVGLVRRAVTQTRITYIPNASSIPVVTLSAAERHAVRDRYLGGRDARLVAYFGFIYPHKGLEALFEIAHPDRDRLVIIGELSRKTPYHQTILQLADSPTWNGHVSFAGFCSPDDTATLLASADAVVLPFIDGAGVWNSSVHAAVLQGTPVVTTSAAAHFDADRLIHYSRPGDTAAMRAGLDQVAGLRGRAGAGDEWQRIAADHEAVYRRAIGTDG